MFDTYVTARVNFNKDCTPHQENPDNCLTSSGHALNKDPDGSRCDSEPLFFQNCTELVQIVRRPWRRLTWRSGSPHKSGFFNNCLSLMVMCINFITLWVYPISVCLLRRCRISHHRQIYGYLIQNCRFQPIHGSITYWHVGDGPKPIRHAFRWCESIP